MKRLEFKKLSYEDKSICSAIELFEKEILKLNRNENPILALDFFYEIKLNNVKDNKSYIYCSEDYKSILQSYIKEKGIIKEDYTHPELVTIINKKVYEQKENNHQTYTINSSDTPKTSTLEEFKDYLKKKKFGNSIITVNNSIELDKESSLNSKVFLILNISSFGEENILAYKIAEEIRIIIFPEVTKKLLIHFNTLEKEKESQMIFNTLKHIQLKYIDTLEKQTVKKSSLSLLKYMKNSIIIAENINSQERIKTESRYDKNKTILNINDILKICIKRINNLCKDKHILWRAFEIENSNLNFFISKANNNNLFCLNENIIIKICSIQYIVEFLFDEILVNSIKHNSQLAPYTLINIDSNVITIQNPTRTSKNDLKAKKKNNYRFGLNIINVLSEVIGCKVDIDIEKINSDNICKTQIII